MLSSLSWLLGKTKPMPHFRHAEWYKLNLLWFIFRETTKTNTKIPNHVCWPEIDEIVDTFKKTNICPSL